MRPIPEQWPVGTIPPNRHRLLANTFAGSCNVPKCRFDSSARTTSALADPDHQVQNDRIVDAFRILTSAPVDDGSALRCSTISWPSESCPVNSLDILSDPRRPHSRRAAEQRPPSNQVTGSRPDVFEDSIRGTARRSAVSCPLEYQRMPA